MNTKSNIMRTTAAALALVYFFTNCAWAHKPATSIWEVRRKVPAMVPLMASTLSAIPKSTINEFPNLTAYGSIRKVIPPIVKNRKAPIVLHIQDVHMNLEAQTNIGNVVSVVLKDNPQARVALEGAFSEIKLDAFARFPEKQTLARVADYLLRDSKLSGPMHAALTHPSLALSRMIGIDDETAYNANVRAYQQSAPLLKKKKENWSRRANELKAQKKKVFNYALLAFDEQASAARQGTISIGEFLQSTYKAHPEAFSKAQPETKNFVTALQMEQSLDFNRVGEERNQLSARLISTLDEQARGDFLKISLAYQKNQLSAMDFYFAFHDLCRKKGVDLTPFPAMKTYLSYVAISGQIDSEKLLQETRHLEEATYASLVRSEAERALVKTSQQWGLVGKLLDFALTREE